MTWVNVGVTAGSAILGGAMAKREKGKQDRLADEQAAYEYDREARIDRTRGVVNSLFDAPRRQQQYADYVRALREYYAQQLGKRKTDVSRELKFTTARQGLTGGSFDVDSRGRLGDEFADAAVQNERQAQQGLTGLQAQDEQSRLDLLDFAGQGMNATTAARRGNTKLSQNLGTSMMAAQQKGLGDTFAATAATSKAIKDRAQLKRGFGPMAANRTYLYDDGSNS